MPAPFPHHYEVALGALGQGSGQLEVPGRPPILGGAPPEFDGKMSWWSPEHLLLSSLALCLMTTFQAFAAKDRLEVLGYSSRTNGTLDKTPAGLAFTSLILGVEVKVAKGDVERAGSLLHAAKKHCIVANSLRTPVALEVFVAAAEPALAR